MPNSDEYASANTKREAVMEGVSRTEALLYTVLYTLLTGSQSSDFFAWTCLILEDIQLLSLITKNQFGFYQMPSYITYILNPFLTWQISTAGPSFYAALSIVCVIVTLVTGLGLYVGTAFAKGNFSHLEPLLVLRVLAKLCITFLAMPILEVLLRTFSCTNGRLGVVDGITCWSARHTPIAVFGILFTVLAILGSIVLISLYYDHTPLKGRKVLHSQPHARYNLYYYFTKAIVIAVTVFVPSATTAIAIVFIATLLCFVVLIRTQPYYSEKVTQVRSGFLFMTTIAALVGLISVGAQGDCNYAGLVVMLVSLIPSYYFGSETARRTLRYIERSTMQRLQAHWQQVEDIRAAKKASPMYNKALRSLKLTTEEPILPDPPLVSVPPVGSVKPGTVKLSAVQPGVAVAQAPAIIAVVEKPKRRMSEREKGVLSGKTLFEVSQQAKAIEIEPFAFVWDVEIVARFISTNESDEGLASIDLIFQDAAEQFPESPMVNLWQGYYAQTYNCNTTLAMQHVKDAERKEPPFDIRYSIFHVRKALQEETHAEALGLRAFGPVKILDVIQFETKLERAKLAHHGALLTMKYYYTQLKTDQLNVHSLSALANLLSKYDKEAKENYLSLIDRFASRAGIAMRLYASYLGSVAIDIEGMEYYINLANSLESEVPRDIPLGKESEEDVLEVMTDNSRSLEDLSESLSSDHAAQSQELVRQAPTISSARFRSTESIVPTRRRRSSIIEQHLAIQITESGHLFQNPPQAREVPNVTTTEPGILQNSTVREESASEPTKANISKALAQNNAPSEGSSNNARAARIDIRLMFAIRMILFAIIFTVAYTQLNALADLVSKVETAFSCCHTNAKLLYTMRYVQMAASASNTALYARQLAQARSLTKQLNALLLSDFEFPYDIEIFEPRPNGYGSDMIIYTPAGLVTQIMIHSAAFFALPASAFTDGSYQLSSDWRFFMDNYSVLMLCFRTMGYNYQETIWSTMIQMLIIVACLALVLILALIGQIYLIFEPLLRTATTASGTLLRMMRALPVSDVTSMLTSVTEDYETFVETSGLAAQPTVDNNAFTQLESETTRSEEMTKRQRSYLMALGVVFCFVVAITFVAIFGLMQRGRQSWLEGQVAMLEYYSTTGLALQFEVIAADRTTWKKNEAEAQLQNVIAKSVDVVSDIGIGFYKRPGYQYRADLAAIVDNPACASSCNRSFTTYSITPFVNTSLEASTATMNNLMSITVVKGFNGTVMNTFTDTSLGSVLAMSGQMTTAMEAYTDKISDIMTDEDATMHLWLIIVFVLAVLNCMLAHRIVNMKLIAGLLHELEETVNLFWTVPLDSMLSVPIIERFLQTGTIVSGSEEESLLKSRSRKKIVK